jgi:hypothetical protein
MAELTRPQIARPASLPDGHAIVGERPGSPRLERPDGWVVRLQPNRRLVATALVSRVQSYLHLERCRGRESFRARMLS